jgi:beta-galactosidase
MRKLRAAILLSLVILPCMAAQRTTMPLDGNWDIADSVSPTEIPAVFTHKAPVPGLAHSATPAFADVDLFDSQEVIANRISKGELPESAMLKGVGVSHQNRNYFWYRRIFIPSGRRALALVKINKAQFGTAVWLNGRKIGEHRGCFTASIFNITDAARWDDKNELLVRVGAHPGVLPETVNGGTDFEKNRWTPGIYDSVSLLLSDNPAIESVQVAPRIQTSEIVVQATVRNYGATSASFAVTLNVTAWKRAPTRAHHPSSEARQPAC